MIHLDEPIVLYGDVGKVVGHKTINLFPETNDVIVEGEIPSEFDLRTNPVANVNIDNITVNLPAPNAPNTARVIINLGAGYTAETVNLDQLVRAVDGARLARLLEYDSGGFGDGAVEHFVFDYFDGTDPDTGALVAHNYDWEVRADTAKTVVNGTVYTSQTNVVGSANVGLALTTAITFDGLSVGSGIKARYTDDQSIAIDRTILTEANPTFNFEQNRPIRLFYKNDARVPNNIDFNSGLETRTINLNDSELTGYVNTASIRDSGQAVLDVSTFSFEDMDDTNPANDEFVSVLTMSPNVGDPSLEMILGNVTSATFIWLVNAFHFLDEYMDIALSTNIPDILTSTPAGTGARIRRPLFFVSSGVGDNAIRTVGGYIDVSEARETSAGYSVGRTNLANGLIVFTQLNSPPNGIEESRVRAISDNNTDSILERLAILENNIETVDTVVDNINGNTETLPGSITIISDNIDTISTELNRNSDLAEEAVRLRYLSLTPVEVNSQIPNYITDQSAAGSIIRHINGNIEFGVGTSDPATSVIVVRRQLSLSLGSGEGDIDTFVLFMRNTGDEDITFNFEVDLFNNNSGVLNEAIDRDIDLPGGNILTAVEFDFSGNAGSEIDQIFWRITGLSGDIVIEEEGFYLETLRQVETPAGLTEEQNMSLTEIRGTTKYVFDKIASLFNNRS